MLHIQKIDEENQCLMMAGTSRRKLLEKYQRINIPRPPHDKYPNYIPPQPVENIGTIKLRSSEAEPKKDDVEQYTEPKFAVEKQTELTTPVSLNRSEDGRNNAAESLDKLGASVEGIVNAVNMVANRYSTRKKNLSAKFKTDVDNEQSKNVDNEGPQHVVYRSSIWKKNLCKKLKTEVHNEQPKIFDNKLPKKGDDEVPQNKAYRSSTWRRNLELKAEVHNEQPKIVYNEVLQNVAYRSSTWRRDLSTTVKIEAGNEQPKIVDNEVPKKVDNSVPQNVAYRSSTWRRNLSITLKTKEDNEEPIIVDNEVLKKVDNEAPQNVVEYHSSTLRKNLSPKLKTEVDNEQSKIVYNEVPRHVDNEVPQNGEYRSSTWRKNLSAKLKTAVDNEQHKAGDSEVPQNVDSKPQHVVNTVTQNDILVGFDLKHEPTTKIEIEEQDQQFNSSPERQDRKVLKKVDNEVPQKVVEYRSYTLKKNPSPKLKTEVDNEQSKIVYNELPQNVEYRSSTWRKNLSAKLKTAVDNEQPKAADSEVPQNVDSKPQHVVNTVTQNDILVGFDLQHVPTTKIEIEEQDQQFDSSAERQYKSHSYNDSSGTCFTYPIRQNRSKASWNNVEERCMQNILSKHLALVHGKHIAKPIDKLASANFCEEVHRELEDMRLTQIYRIQSFTWPHLMRGNSLIVVSSPRTGKTMSYLPAICSLIKMKSDEDLVPNTVGPIGIIVAPSSVEVERIAKLCRRFLNRSKTKMTIVESFGIRNTQRTTTFLLNGCEILVATPISLTRLFANKLQLFDSKRIKHLVLDNIEFMHEKMKNELHEILRKCCGLTKSNATTGVQLVVTAKYWNPMLAGFLKICHNPQLCIGAYIEAMVYARSLISMKFIQKKSKVQEISDFINDHSYLSERLIIICNKNEDVDEVVSALKSLSFFYISCNSRSTAIEIELSHEWHIRPCGDMSILVCTDEVLPELKVSTAQNIIHYSLPLSWTKFSFRFSALFDYFEDFVKSNIMRNSPAACLILLDENNNTQLPKLIQFLRTHKSDNIPTEIYDLCNKIKVQREEERRMENKEFCPLVMELGKCLNIDDCKFRHELTSFDAPDENFPINGTVKFKVLHVESPTHYKVRLLEHRPLNEKKWKKIQSSNEYVKFNLNFAQYFSNVENHQTHWPVELNDMCVVIDRNSYYRCHVLYVDKSKNDNIVSDVNIRVKLVDIGRNIMCKSSRVLVLPKLFQDYPHQAVNLRLAGVVPYDHEQEWDSHAIRVIQNWIGENMGDSIHIEGKIKFTLMDTIWVENIDLVENLSSISTDVKIINIKRALLDKFFASISYDAEEALKELASNCGILKDFDTACTQSTSTHKKDDFNIGDERSSSANGGSVCSSISSLSAHYKISNDYSPLEISNTTNNSKQISNSGSMNNSSKQNSPKPLKNNIKPITVNGTVPAKELWENLMENQPCRISVATFYSPNNFYVLHLAKLERQEELYNAIDRYVEKNRLIVTDPKIGLNCLVEFEGKYNRAKITKVLCDGESNGLNVSLFLCDIGISENRSLSEVLHSSNQLVNMLPFQAIRCKMIGIMPNKYGVWTDDVSDRIYDEIIDQSHFLYARAVKFEEPNKQSDLQYWKCDVLLIDCSTAMDININENIVEKGLAQCDPETSHFLDMLLNVISSDDESDNSSDRNWDTCNYTRTIVPKLNQSLDLNDLNMVDMDVVFSQDDIRQLLNLPPTAKILPPLDREEIKSQARITELNDQNVKSKSIGNQLDERIPSKCTDKVLDLNAYITSRATSELERSENNALPALKALYKSPQVIWQQSESLIYLRVSAPDITDYYLKVTSRCLIFMAKIDDEVKMLMINFCGCINSDLVSHEIRGLKVIVRLPKAIKGLPWPRLTFDSDKLSWLNYNYDSIIVEQEILINTNRYPLDSYIMDHSSDSDSGGEESIHDIQINDEFDPWADDFIN